MSPVRPRPRQRRVISAAVVTALLWVTGVAGASIAHADPADALAPNSGPSAGGTTVTIPEPEGVTFTSVSARGAASVALTSEGIAYAWGNGPYGELGSGEATSHAPVPVPVTMPEGVTFTSVSVGGSHALALGSDGNTYAWGSDDHGALGDGGSETDQWTPVRVVLPEGVTFTSVSAGWAHSLAIGSDGLTYAWGRNWGGTLGDGTEIGHAIPTPVRLPEGVLFTSVSAGSDMSVAIGSDGVTYAWGLGNIGQLGNGEPGWPPRSLVPVPVRMPPGVTFTSVSAGEAHTLAIGSDGGTYAWGNDYFGQLGNGGGNSLSWTPTPVTLPNGVTFTSVSASSKHSLAIGSDGLTYAWGYGIEGLLGDGTNEDRAVPTKVSPIPGVAFTDVSAGGWHMSTALGADGNVYAWGANSAYQLGDGTDVGRSTPVKVATPEAVVVDVAFGDAPGSGLVDNGDGSWSVVTPAHLAGPVDVVVEWTLGGVSQTPIVYPGGFTFVDPVVAPTISDPVDQTVVEGATGSFAVEVSGAPRPAVSWEVSPDGGATWVAATASVAAVSADGLTLEIDGSVTTTGVLVRATATNDAGSATSAPATLTVTPRAYVHPEAPDSLGNHGTGRDASSKSQQLAQTGADTAAVHALVAAGLLVLGGAAALVCAAARRHRSS